MVDRFIEVTRMVEEMRRERFMNGETEVENPLLVSSGFHARLREESKGFFLVRFV